MWQKTYYIFFFYKLKFTSVIFTLKGILIVCNHRRLIIIFGHSLNFIFTKKWKNYQLALKKYNKFIIFTCQENAITSANTILYIHIYFLYFINSIYSAGFESKLLMLMLLVQVQLCVRIVAVFDVIIWNICSHSRGFCILEKNWSNCVWVSVCMLSVRMSVGWCLVYGFLPSTLLPQIIYSSRRSRSRKSSNENIYFSVKCSINFVIRHIKYKNIYLKNKKNIYSKQQKQQLVTATSNTTKTWILLLT